MIMFCQFGVYHGIPHRCTKPTIISNCLLIQHGIPLICILNQHQISITSPSYRRGIMLNPFFVLHCFTIKSPVIYRYLLSFVGHCQRAAFASHGIATRQSDRIGAGRMCFWMCWNHQIPLDIFRGILSHIQYYICNHMYIYIYMIMYIYIWLCI